MPTNGVDLVYKTMHLEKTFLSSIVKKMSVSAANLWNIPPSLVPPKIYCKIILAHTSLPTIMYPPLIPNSTTIQPFIHAANTNLAVS